GKRETLSRSVPNPGGVAMRQSGWQCGRDVGARPAASDGGGARRRGRRALARGAGVALGVALAGVTAFAPTASASAPCTTVPASGGQWPMYGHDVANTRSQPEPSGLTPSGVKKLAPVWAFSTASTGDGTGF